MGSLYLLTTIFIFLPLDLQAYPVFGTKRYGRNSNPMQTGWGMSSPMQVPSYYYQSMPRSHYPLSYYDSINPYAQEYTDEYYYPQENINYPMYYHALARSNPAYEYYQPALPIYYGDRHFPRNGYGYYDGGESVDGLQEEMLQEVEREEREEALPVGQETWYETDSTPETDESMDDINAAFLQDLMLYHDALAASNKHYGTQNEYIVDPYLQQYNDEIINWNEEKELKNYQNEDKDVKELKMLTEKPKKQKNKNKNKQLSLAQERMQMFEKGNGKHNQKSNAASESNNSEAWINYNNKRNNLRNKFQPIANMAYKKQEHNEHGPMIYKDKAMKFSTRKQKTSNNVASTSSTPNPITTTKGTKEPPRDARGGQKEVVLMRPATPVRRPFSEPVMELLAQQGGPERKRTPSVYDTIKHLLEMEKNLEEEYQREEIRPQMRKRYVTSEDNLVDQLSTLKKTA